MEKCVIDRDSLFAFVIVQNTDLASKLKQLNAEGLLQLRQVELMKEQIQATYNYASDLSIFNFANSEFKNRHSIKQYIVILSVDDFFNAWS